MQAPRGPGVFGGGGRLIAPFHSLADFGTPNDPNAILQSSAQAGRYMRLQLKNHTTASGLPGAGVTYSIALRDLAGHATTAVATRLLNAFLMWSGDADPPGTDVALYGGFSAGAIGSDTEGVGVQMKQSSTDWLLSRIRKPTSGVWAVGNSATLASSTAIGARGLFTNNNSSIQGSFSCCPINSDRTADSTTNHSPTLDTSIAVAAATYTHLFVGAGWNAGSGGTDGTYVTVQIMEMMARILDFLNTDHTTVPP